MRCTRSERGQLPEALQSERSCVLRPPSLQLPGLLGLFLSNPGLQVTPLPSTCQPQVLR